MHRPLLLASLAWAGCSAPTPRVAPTRAETTKASLFGDAAVVPTRAGEHARTELALSAELRRVARALPSVRDATVTVRVPQPRRGPRSPAPGPPRALVALTLVHTADAASVVAEVRALAQTWLGEDVQMEVAWAHAEAPSLPDPPPLGMLVLALLGLGAAGGITVDRAVDRRRRAKRTPTA